jgi:hypothetical protein
LREFRERLRDIVGAPQLIPPHISLLYTLDRNSQAPRPDFDDERLKAIAAGCAKRSTTRISLWAGRSSIVLAAASTMSAAGT